MAEERTQRRLAAILAADVVGYSRLMEADEAGTLAVLKARRKEVLEPLVISHRGRVFKVTGDGVVVEFGSAVNAVECAVELQQRMAAANDDLPEAQRIVLRIGINLGDVMVEGGDLYGEAVNISARLEAMAPPGGILVSGTAFDYIRNKVDARLEYLGPQNLRNIAEPVRVYRVAGTPHVSAAMRKVAIDKPSIAVLPFVNMSGDPEQQYFSDGITEDIITELSRFRQLLVIARQSSFAFRDEAVGVAEIARRLGVQYVVEGSVRNAGDRVRITAQLIDAASGNHIWAERYDRELRDIFAVQDEVTRTIVATLSGRLEDAGAKVAKRKHPESLAAYDYLLRAIEYHQRFTKEDNERARQMLLTALELDPEFAAAYGYLALVNIADMFRDGSLDALDRAFEPARKALALDDNDARSHLTFG